jgi:sporulation protein YlmC with PRC-barrel domain
MLRVKKINEVLGKDVYTSEGDFFGHIEEANLMDNKVEGWRIKIGSGFMNVFGGARGVVVPHQFIKAVGDIIIINKGSLPTHDQSVEVSPEMANMGSDPENLVG